MPTPLPCTCQQPSNWVTELLQGPHGFRAFTLEVPALGQPAGTTCIGTSVADWLTLADRTACAIVQKQGVLFGRILNTLSTTACLFVLSADELEAVVVPVEEIEQIWLLHAYTGQLSADLSPQPGQ